MAYNAPLAGAGVEVSVALGLTVGDVDRRLQEVHAPGTKTHSRDRVVRVAQWTWPWTGALLRGKRPHERPFATIPDRWVANDAFRVAIAPLAKKQPKVFDDYWMRDGRHTYAVRAIKGGRTVPSRGETTWPRQLYPRRQGLQRVQAFEYRASALGGSSREAGPQPREGDNTCGARAQVESEREAGPRNNER